MAMSITTPGRWLSGYDDLAQSIALFFRTPKGSIPLHPELGCGIFEYVDRSPRAVLGLIRDMRNGLALWDTRYIVTRVFPIFSDSGVTVRVTYSPADDTTNQITIPIIIPLGA